MRKLKFPFNVTSYNFYKMLVSPLWDVGRFKFKLSESEDQ